MIIEDLRKLSNELLLKNRDVIQKIFACPAGVMALKQACGDNGNNYIAPENCGIADRFSGIALHECPDAHVLGHLMKFADEGKCGAGLYTNSEGTLHMITTEDLKLAMGKIVMPSVYDSLYRPNRAGLSHPYKPRSSKMEEAQAESLDVESTEIVAVKPNSVTQERINMLLDASDTQEHTYWEKELVISYRLPNGFTISGRGACVDPKNFDIEMGRKIAREDAVNQLWKLEGYLLQQVLFDGNRTGQESEAGKVIRVAKVAHEINKAYCIALGDISQPSWEDAPDWQKESACDGVLFHQANPDADASTSHNSWMKQKLDDGWCWGEKKDPDAKTHPCIVCFEDLSVSQQAKNFLFRQVVHSLN